MALLGILLALVLLPVVESDRDVINSDWPVFAIAGSAVVSDPAHLYDRSAQRRRQELLLGPGGFQQAGQGGILPFVSPPWVALAAAPFSPLGLAHGGRAWVLFQLAAMLAGAALAAERAAWWTAVAATAGVPAALLVANAQIDGLVVLGLGAAWRLHLAQRDLPAGLALGLTLVKPHLVLPLALMVLIARRWALLGGWALALAALVVASEARDRGLMGAWIAAATANGGRIGSDLSLPGLAWALGLGPAGAAVATMVAAVIVAAMAWWLRSCEGVAAAALVLGGLLAAPHALATDLVLAATGLIPAGRARFAPLLLLSAGALVTALIHPPWATALCGIALLAALLALLTRTAPPGDTYNPRLVWQSKQKSRDS